MFSIGPKATLRRVRKLIEKGFSQKAYARNTQDQSVDPLSPKAVKFCLEGARLRVNISSESSALFYRLLEKVVPLVPCRNSVIVFNDTHAQAEVLEAIDRAIAYEGE